MFGKDFELNESYELCLHFGKNHKKVGKNHAILVNQLIGINKSNEYDADILKIDVWKEEETAPDIITDLSTIRLENRIPLWKVVVNKKNFIAATLPIYTVKDKRNITKSEIISIIQEQIEGGVGMITIHPTPSKELVDLAQKRITPVTSRGGKIVITDMILHSRKTNIYIESLDDIINICREYNSIISIGTSFRSANIIDSFDEVQIKEINEQIKIADYISNKGVGVIIESPGHANIENIKKICKLLNQTNYPVMPLGPVVTDIGIGLDHITSAIGATIMGLEGCVQIIAAMTREEHTGNVPSIESTVEAVKVAKLVAHIIDSNKNRNYSKDEYIARNRKKSCVYGGDSLECSRCSDFCPLK